MLIAPDVVVSFFHFYSLFAFALCIESEIDNERKKNRICDDSKKEANEHVNETEPSFAQCVVQIKVWSAIVAVAPSSVFSWNLFQYTHNAEKEIFEFKMKIFSFFHISSVCSDWSGFKVCFSSMEAILFCCICEIAMTKCFASEWTSWTHVNPYSRHAEMSYQKQKALQAYPPNSSHFGTMRLGNIPLLI